MGIKRLTASGETGLLVEQRFAFNGATAILLADALRRVDGVSVETVRLNDQFQQVEWQPTFKPTYAGSTFLFVLGWSGFLAGILTQGKWTIFLVGIVCVVVFLVVNRWNARDRGTGKLVLVLSAFQFGVLYVVLALLGSAMRR
jgi:hypothetical protein